MSRPLADPVSSATAAALAMASAGLSGREQAMLWLPWAVLGLTGSTALLLVGWLALSLLDARSLRDRYASELAPAALASAGRLHGGRSGGPSWHDLEADVPEMEAAVAALVVDAPVMLERVEALATQSGAKLLQFVPEVASDAVSNALPVLRLELRAPLHDIERFLMSLNDTGPVVEIAALRLAAGKVPDEVHCELTLRLHDEASLTTLATLSDPPVARVASDPAQWIPDGAFAPAVAPSEIPAAPASGSQRMSPPSIHVAQVDPLAGLRLLGLLREGDRVAALIDVPGEGAVLLRPSGRLGQTGFQLESIGLASVTLASGPGRQRLLVLDAYPVGAR